MLADSKRADTAGTEVLWGHWCGQLSQAQLAMSSGNRTSRLQWSRQSISHYRGDHDLQSIR